jgi:hypothetical protein
MRFAAALVCVMAFGQTPALPRFDWGECPGEYCRYGAWTVQQPVTLFNTYKAGRHPVGRLAAGEKVTGMTGVVITYEPGVIRMDRDLPDAGLRRGETFLTYGYPTEGFSAVLVHGKYLPWFDISFAKWPDFSGCGNEHCAATVVDLGRKAWWAQVKLASGRTGWVEMKDAQIAVYP